jgi:dCTP deaminase
MILSNVEILNCIGSGSFSIKPLAGNDPQRPPFNTSAVDLRLSDEIMVPEGGAFQIDLSGGGIAKLLQQNSKRHNITSAQPFSLKPNQLVLARTVETVDFPILDKEICYSARVEGRSSLARCGILVHFTAPTIHSGFSGSITLEIINLGPQSFLLTQNMFVCQLIIEEVRGRPADAPNQFRGQSTPAGT